jgi:hypothetical protein
MLLSRKICNFPFAPIKKRDLPITTHHRLLDESLEIMESEVSEALPSQMNLPTPYLTP